MTHLFETNPPGRHFVISRRVPLVTGSGNLVLNGKFEDGGAYWGSPLQESGGQVIVSIDESVPLEGDGSLLFVMLSGSVIGHSRQTKTPLPFDAQNEANLKFIAVKAGDVLRVQGQLRASTNEYIAAAIWTYDQTKTLLDLEFLALGTNTGLATGTAVKIAEMYVVPEGVHFINLGVTAFEEVPTNFSGRSYDQYDVRKIGSADELLLNRDFEAGGSFWSKGTAGSASVVEVDPLTGAASLKIVSSSVSSVQVYQSNIDASLPTNARRFSFPVLEGQIWEFESTARAQADHDAQFFAIPVDANGNGIGQPSKLLTTHEGEGVTTESGFYEIPAGVDFIAVQMSVATDPSGPRDYFFDELSMKLAESTVTERLDETQFVDGYWMSPQLNRGGTLVHRFVKLFLQYSCVKSTTIDVSFTANGGADWTNERTIRLDKTGESIGQAIVNAQVTGHDIRFRLHFNAALVSIFGYSAETYPANELTNLGD